MKLASKATMSVAEENKAPDTVIPDDSKNFRAFDFVDSISNKSGVDPNMGI